MEKYSVLMSVYQNDNPRFLDKSIESMLGQSHMCEQFVIVQDGPLTEEQEQLIEQYRQNWPGLFTIIPLEKNVGLGAALDIGLEYCRNELVARMDSDDISQPNRCERQLECFTIDPELDIVGSYINEFSNDPQDIHSSRVVPCTHNEIVAFARRRSPFNHPTVMFKKSAVIRCGGYGSTRRKEDLYLFPAMVNSGCKAANIPEALLLYRSDLDNLKRRKTWLNCKEYIQVILHNYKKGYSRLSDVVYVAIAQTIFYLLPMRAAKIFSDVFLRKKPIS